MCQCKPVSKWICRSLLSSCIPLCLCFYHKFLSNFFDLVQFRCRTCCQNLCEHTLSFCVLCGYKHASNLEEIWLACSHTQLLVFLVLHSNRWSMATRENLKRTIPSPPLNSDWMGVLWSQSHGNHACFSPCLPLCALIFLFLWIHCKEELFLVLAFFFQAIHVKPTLTSLLQLESGYY